jgi:hypothetical protein
VPRTTLHRAALVASALLAAATGCNAIFGLHEKQLEDSADAANAEATAGDGPIVQGDGALPEGASAEAGPDGAPSACPFDATGAGDLRSPGCWSTFDLTAANPAVATAPGTEGVAFDGRYMYLAPAPGAIVLRYDTTAPFADARSWSSFDVKAQLGFQPRFSGAMFDGRYVTFAPQDVSPLVVRFDTTATFTDPASWSTFDPTPLGVDVNGFAGATFDGQFAYLAPHGHTTLLRHDTRAAIATGWEIFDVAQVQSTVLTAFWGGVFDGNAVYLAPNDGVVVRYETTKPFASTSSWSKFDTVIFHAGGLSFEGGAFDGRYLYMSPGGSESFVVRFDTQGTFTDAGAWAAFDMGQLSPTLGLFSGAAFDGRFLYFQPWGARNFQPNKQMVRYDVTKDFATPASWTLFDLGTVGAVPVGGAAFDGRFVYFMPDEGGTKVARFEARKTPQKLTLPAFFGSFY